MLPVREQGLVKIWANLLKNLSKIIVVLSKLRQLLWANLYLSKPVCTILHFQILVGTLLGTLLTKRLKNVVSVCYAKFIVFEFL